MEVTPSLGLLWRCQTSDRRLSTVCGMYRFAHIDGRISSNPAQYVHRPKVHESQTRQIAARHDDPRTTVGYDHRRANFDKHASYVVVAFVARG